jgi:hypothetical protein
MADLKIKPPTTDLFYVTIDGTRAIDSLALGQLWKGFSWNNLLSGLNKSPTDSSRRVDNAHTKLPVRFVNQTQLFAQSSGPPKKGSAFADIVIMPEGRDGEGVDAGNWPSNTKTGNVAEINAANTFIQGFILSPTCDPAASALGSGSRVADLVYVSSHGVRTGDMFGTASDDIDEVDPFFILAKAAAGGGKFNGVKWLILSNCNTLVSETHNDWLKLMTASKSFRGILGYHGTSVAADQSSGADVSFVRQLSAGKSMMEAWRQANKAWGMADRWVVMCHDAAKGDTIAQWNAGTLAGISFKPPDIKLFDESNLKGSAVVNTPDPFGLFWSKTVSGTTTKITPGNRYNKGNKIKTGDDVSITVVSAPKSPKFAAGSTVEVTLIFVRDDYPEEIDIDRMFKITAKSGIDPAVTTVHRNTGRPDLGPKRPDKGPDTWVMKVPSAVASITLGLNIVKLFLGKAHHNLPFWLRATIKAADGSNTVPEFDFIHDAAIYAA